MPVAYFFSLLITLSFPNKTLCAVSLLKKMYSTYVRYLSLIRNCLHFQKTNGQLNVNEPGRFKVGRELCRQAYLYARSYKTQLNSAHLAEGLYPLSVCIFARPGKPSQFPQPEKPMHFPSRENLCISRTGKPHPKQLVYKINRVFRNPPQLPLCDPTNTTSCKLPDDCKLIHFRISLTIRTCNIIV